MPKQRHNWRKVKAWRSHSVACWDSEWAEWKRAAEAQGKSVNGWIREWLQEAVKYERLTELERGDPVAGHPAGGPRG